MAVIVKFDDLRKYVTSHQGVLGMVMPPEDYVRFCRIYVKGCFRPSTEEMNSHVRYLRNLGADEI